MLKNMAIVSRGLYRWWLASAPRKERVEPLLMMFGRTKVRGIQAC